MPEYFFHVALELLSDPNVDLKHEQTLPSRVAVTQALSPFTKSSRIVNESRLGSPTVSGFRQSPSQSRHQPSKDLGALPSQPVPSSPNDQRLDDITIESMDMTRPGRVGGHDATGDKSHVGTGIGSATNGLQTKGRYVPLGTQSSGSVWGIVHLYRDAEETPGLYGDSPLSQPTDPWLHGFARDNMGPKHAPPADQDCTTLCVLAVPSYMSPSDFLGFVGEETLNEVSHFRMIKTARANRYMVLMKFRHGKKAREWQQEWNGKVFNSIEVCSLCPLYNIRKLKRYLSQPETCHVVFLKSVEITQSTAEPNVPSSGPPTYPTMSNDPFSFSHPTTKPLAPRTPSLIELPTCPVCLERMDETTGLLTILCQHVFHCTCLQKWSGGGCPVCRYTHDDFSSRPGVGLGGSSKYKYKNKGPGMEYDGDPEHPLECETCRIDANLWQCLICGKVGCGRYEAKHAFTHFEESGHCFAMDMESKRVWDYAGDGYVHRIIQDAGTGEKLVELPGSRRGLESTALEGNGDFEDEKMEGLALEYTHLLTSQLESQRVYFEEKVERAADKASKAAAAASSAADVAVRASAELTDLKSKYDDLARDAVPALEKEKARLERRSEKFESMAREMEKGFREEKAINVRLMERIEHLSKEVEGLKLVKTDLEEQNRDLTFFISSSEKLKEAGEDVQEGTVSVPDPPAGKKKGKGKGRK